MKSGAHIAFALILLLALSAHAGEGRLEINQACATGEGCFAGDNPGFPVEITTSGSYMLTSDLDVTVATSPPDTTAIDVSAEDVSIDLNEFAIRGPVACDLMPVTSCSNTGSGRGVDGDRGIFVKNGTIRGMGSDGIALGFEGEAANVRVIENGSDGIVANTRSRIADVIAFRNANDGVSVGDFAVVQDSRAIGNGDNGLAPGGGSLLRDSVANENGSDGIFLPQKGASAIDNVAQLNREYGLDCEGSRAGVRGNVVSGNSSGQVEGTCTLVDDNICDGAPC